MKTGKNLILASIIKAKKIDEYRHKGLTYKEIAQILHHNKAWIITLHHYWQRQSGKIQEQKTEVKNV